MPISVTTSILESENDYYSDIQVLPLLHGKIGVVGHGHPIKPMHGKVRDLPLFIIIYGREIQSHLHNIG